MVSSLHNVFLFFLTSLRPLAHDLCCAFSPRSVRDPRGCGLRAPPLCPSTGLSSPLVQIVAPPFRSNEVCRPLVLVDIAILFTSVATHLRPTTTPLCHCHSSATHSFLNRHRSPTYILFCLSIFCFSSPLFAHLCFSSIILTLPPRVFLSLIALLSSLSL